MIRLTGLIVHRFDTQKAGLAPGLFASRAMLRRGDSFR